MSETKSLGFVLFWMTIPFYVIGFIGYVLVIRIVHKTREMHTPTNYLLVNMAVGDVITILLWSLYFFEFETFVCKIVTLTEVCIMASIITLTVLAVERYHALLKPLGTELRLTEGNVKKAIAFVWIASFFICLPEVFFNEWSDTYSTCIGPWTLHMDWPSKVYVIKRCTQFLYTNGSRVLMAVVCCRNRW